MYNHKTDHVQQPLPEMKNVRPEIHHAFTIAM